MGEFKSAIEGVDWADASSLQQVVSGEAPTIRPEQQIPSINEPSTIELERFK